MRSYGKLIPHFLAKYLSRQVMDAAHMALYRSRALHQDTRFLGFPIDQMPTDMWLYQEVIFAERPGFILQTGVDRGGSILYFAAMLDLIGANPDAIVVGIDVLISDWAKRISHPRVRLIEGSSTDPAVIAKVEAILPNKYGLVVLDSDHSESHVRAELAAYSRFTEVGRPLVVEDANINGHPVYSSFGPGPKEAVDEFLAGNESFVRDDQLWRRYLFSFHQFGWLVRRR